MLRNVLSTQTGARLFTVTFRGLATSYISPHDIHKPSWIQIEFAKHNRIFGWQWKLSWEWNGMTSSVIDCDPVWPGHRPCPRVSMKGFHRGPRGRFSNRPVITGRCHWGDHLPFKVFLSLVFLVTPAHVVITGVGRHGIAYVIASLRAEAMNGMLSMPMYVHL